MLQNIIIIIIIFRKDPTVKKSFVTTCQGEKKVSCNSKAKGVVNVIADRSVDDSRSTLEDSLPPWTSNPRHSGLNAWLARAFFK